MGYMTGRTHDLAAFTLLNAVFFVYKPDHLSAPTVIAAIAGSLVGGLLPDIDDHASLFWQKIPMGTFWGRIVHPFIGSHRMITHSLVGMFLAGVILQFLYLWMGRFILVDFWLVWLATMIGYISHLLADSLTHDGIPLFFPIPGKIGFPPIRSLRMKTGGIIEFAIVFPLLLVANGYLFTKYSSFYFAFVKSLTW